MGKCGECYVWQRLTIYAEWHEQLFKNVNGNLRRLEDLKYTCAGNASYQYGQLGLIKAIKMGAGMDRADDIRTK